MGGRHSQTCTTVHPGRIQPNGIVLRQLPARIQSGRQALLSQGPLPHSPCPVSRENDRCVHVTSIRQDCRRSFMVRSHLTAAVPVFTAVFNPQAAEVGWGFEFKFWLQYHLGKGLFALSCVSLTSLCRSDCPPEIGTALLHIAPGRGQGSTASQTRSSRPKFYMAPAPAHLQLQRPLCGTGTASEKATGS